MTSTRMPLVVGTLLVACLAAPGWGGKAPISGGGPLAQILQAICPNAGAQTRTAPKPKKGFVEDIAHLTLANQDYRRVLYTGQHMQLVLMSLKPGEEIGAEVHPTIDQFFRIETGEGELVINGVTRHVSAGFAMIVPAGARHNVRNTGTKPLKLYTIYAPPQHQRDVVQRTKAEAEREHEHFDGKTNE